MEKQLQIAIDGPAGSGKSTIAKLVAEKLSLTYLDTGAMYRAITWKIQKRKLDLRNIVALKELLEHTYLELQQSSKGQKVLCDGTDVTEEIRSLEVTAQVSEVSALPQVRKYLVAEQQKYATKNVIMDGRDIGTTVLPFATYKFFLIASPAVRAQRRLLELEAKGVIIDYQQVLDDILRRDAADSNRLLSPLCKAADALEIDTSNLSITEVVTVILSEVADKRD